MFKVICIFVTAIILVTISIALFPQAPDVGEYIQRQIDGETISMSRWCYVGLEYLRVGLVITLIAFIVFKIVVKIKKENEE